jgi:branched chain amino acid efflux pump
MTAWIVVAVLFVGTAALRAAGPVAFGARNLSGRGAVVVALFAPALLGALVVYETVGAGGQGIELDARLVGLAAAGLALVLRLPLLAVVLIAAVATALTRL